MNKAVGINEVKGMSVLIKTIQTGEEIGIVRGIINQDL
jgi:hypothetical protein